jgi:hypothetical protein
MPSCVQLLLYSNIEKSGADNGVLFCITYCNLAGVRVHATYLVQFHLYAVVVAQQVLLRNRPFYSLQFAVDLIRPHGTFGFQLISEQQAVFHRLSWNVYRPTGCRLPQRDVVIFVGPFSRTLYGHSILKKFTWTASLGIDSNHNTALLYIAWSNQVFFYPETCSCILLQGLVFKNF